MKNNNCSHPARTRVRARITRGTHAASSNVHYRYRAGWSVEAAARAVRARSTPRRVVGAPLFLLACALPLSEEGTCEGSKGTKRRHPSTHTLCVSTGAAPNARKRV